ncbi:MAG: thiol-disulfide oxidoreductase [Flavobacteriaceae bacterium]|nr:MAG: thiol-disulfide oxidoreductase [Flavobacteriaceae bacterium]
MIVESKKIILFDGVCNLCNNSINYVIKKDKKDIFRFAALQSEIGQKLTAERNIDTSKVDSIILIDPGVSYYTKSDAALKIMNEFGGAWKLFTVFTWLPVGLRDIVYDFIAKNRYKWYGKKDACMVPTSELKGKFL